MKDKVDCLDTDLFFEMGYNLLCIAGLDEYEATMFIRNELKCFMPIIGLTANVYKEDVDNCLLAGMNGHLGKPYSESQIFNIIEKWCIKSVIEQKSVQEKFTNLILLRVY